jgi:hypothetical protein
VSFALLVDDITVVPLLSVHLAVLLDKKIIINFNRIKKKGSVQVPVFDPYGSDIKTNAASRIIVRETSTQAPRCSGHFKFISSKCLNSSSLYPLVFAFRHALSGLYSV